VLFLAFVRYQQNHHQVFNWRTLCCCRGDWHSEIGHKIHWVIVFHIGRAWNFVWGAKPTEFPRGDGITWLTPDVYFENCITKPCQMGHTPFQARNQGGARNPPRKCFAPPGEMFWTSFKTIGHSSKILGPSQKSLRPSCCPKLVTGLRLLDAQQWLQRLTFDGNCVKQFYSVQPLPSSTTISINALFNKSITYNHS